MIAGIRRNHVFTFLKQTDASKLKILRRRLRNSCSKQSTYYVIHTEHTEGTSAYRETSRATKQHTRKYAWEQAGRLRYDAIYMGPPLPGNTMTYIWESSRDKRDV